MLQVIKNKIHRGNIKIPCSNEVAMRAFMCVSLSKKKTANVVNYQLECDEIENFKNCINIIECEKKRLVCENQLFFKYLLTFANLYSETGFTFMMHQYSTIKGCDEFFEQLKMHNLNINKIHDSIIISGKLTSGVFKINADSIDFLHGLLLSLPVIDGKSTIQLINFDEKQIEQIITTIKIAKAFGVNISLQNKTITIKGQQKYKPVKFVAPIDYEYAAYFLAANEFGNKFKIINFKNNQADSTCKLVTSIIEAVKKNKIINLCTYELGSLLPFAILMLSFKTNQSQITINGGFYNDDGIRNLISQFKILGSDITCNSKTITIKYCKNGFAVNQVIDDFLKVNTFNDVHVGMTMFLASCKCNNELLIDNITNLDSRYKSFIEKFW